MSRKSSKQRRQEKRARILARRVRKGQISQQQAVQALRGPRSQPVTTQFRAENFRNVLLNYNNLEGADRQMFEKAVRNMSERDLANLSNMYKNVLETWQESEGYFEALSRELVDKIKGMANQTVNNISRMLAQGDSALDDATVRMAWDGWNFRLNSTKRTWEKALQGGR